MTASKISMMISRMTLLSADLAMETKRRVVKEVSWEIASARETTCDRVSRRALTLRTCLTVVINAQRRKSQTLPAESHLIRSETMFSLRLLTLMHFGSQVSDVRQSSQTSKLSLIVYCSARLRLSSMISKLIWTWVSKMMA